MGSRDEKTERSVILRLATRGRPLPQSCSSPARSRQIHISRPQFFHMQNQQPLLPHREGAGSEAHSRCPRDQFLPVLPCHTGLPEIGPHSSLAPSSVSDAPQVHACREWETGRPDPFDRASMGHTIGAQLISVGWTNTQVSLRSAALILGAPDLAQLSLMCPLCSQIAGYCLCPCRDLRILA